MTPHQLARQFLDGRRDEPTVGERIKWANADAYRDLGPGDDYDAVVGLLADANERLDRHGPKAAQRVITDIRRRGR